MRSFSLNYDYRCPFARLAALHVLDGLEAGAGWEVTFTPFCLSQLRAAESGTSVWEDPASDSGLTALAVSVAVRELHPQSFPRAHRELFDLRHLHGESLRDPAAVEGALERAGLEPPAVLRAVAEGWPLDQVRAEHESSVEQHTVWGVPTFVLSGQAAFVRLMEPPPEDPAEAIATIERLLDLIGGWPELNELKHTTIPR